jgi:hypothetical protein
MTTINVDLSSAEYRAYHARVVAAIRRRFVERWPDLAPDVVERSVDFFDRECTYDEWFAEGLEPADFVDDEIDAAM